MSDKDQNALKEELATLETEQTALYTKIRERKFDEIAKSIAPAPQPSPGKLLDVEIEKAEPEAIEKRDRGERRKRTKFKAADNEEAGFEGDDEEPEAPKPKKSGKAPVDKPKKEVKPGYQYQKKEGQYDTEAADKAPPAPKAEGGTKYGNVKDAHEALDHYRAKWARRRKEPGKPLPAPSEAPGAGTTKKVASDEYDAAYRDIKSRDKDAKDDISDAKEQSSHGDKPGAKMSGSDRYWDHQFNVTGATKDVSDLEKLTQKAKEKGGNVKHSQTFFNQASNAPDSAKHWKQSGYLDALGKAMQKALQIMAEYMYDSVGEALNKSLYSDYESDLIELIKSGFEEERDIAIEEIVKMVMQDDELNNDFENIEKSYDEAESEDEEFVKAFNAMADAIVGLYDELQLMKAAIAGDDEAFDEIAKAFGGKKKKHLIQRRVPEDSEDDEEEENLEDEPEVKKADGSDSKDSKACVRSGDITTKDLKSHTEEGVFPKQGPQPVNKGAFEEGKKIGAIEAIQKSVAEQGVATSAPGETVNQERLDPIAKMLNDNSALLNTSFRALERTIRTPEKD